MVHNFKRISAFSPLFVCSEHFTDVHLKMAKTIAFDDAPYIFIKASTLTSFVDITTRKGSDEQGGNLSKRLTGYILCVQNTGLEFVLPILSPSLPKNGT